jgi:Tat protein secretion system quality control protein TatD with DNase activity
MSTEIATISDKRLVRLDDRLYSDLPVADHAALDLSPIDLFNKKNNSAVPLNSALNLAKVHDKKASLNVQIIGYELGQQEFSQVNPETKEEETIFRNVLYVFCEDGTVLFIHSLTAARPLFEIFRNFGTPSAVNGYDVAIDLVSEKGRTRYMVQLLNIGPKA